ncbi:MAG: hypothetical protein ABIL01_05560 [Pseudomonadota bacterium]
MSNRNVLEIPGFLALGALATLIAGLVGVGIVMVCLGAITLFALMFFSAYFPLMLEALLFTMLLAAPVTFGLFPMAAYLLRGHPILVQFVVPTIGFVAGGAIIPIWIACGLFGPNTHLADELLIAIGMVSGLVAGAFYGRGLQP